jgi:hypothetical protein
MNKNITKVCILCLKRKSIKKFYKHKAYKLGYRNTCKLCDSRVYFNKEKKIRKNKICGSCHQLKDISEFSLDNYKLDGHDSRCKICSNKRTKIYYNINKKELIKKRVNTRYIQKYNMTSKQKKEMIKNQNYRCLCCGCDLRKIPQKLRCIDHDHVKNNVRGVLCHFCNLSLGMMNEDIEKLKLLIIYIEKHCS